MLIVNESNTDASWFCYNSNDRDRAIALASGDLSANGGSFTYDPPENATGKYYVQFTVKGGIGGPGGRVFGGDALTARGKIVLRGSKGATSAVASEPYAAGTGSQAN
jgi:hypothetical protein